MSAITALSSNILFWMWVSALLFFVCVRKKGKNTMRWGVILLMCSWIIGTRPVADSFLNPLETYYASVSVDELRTRGVKDVVVLTGGGFHVKGELLSSAYPHASMNRFLGGLELCARLGSDCRIIFSGSAGRWKREVATAEMMKELTLILEPQRKVSAESISGSTAEHPENVKSILGSKSFALVTSAYHMPRSLHAFRKAGLDPLPFPVDFLTRGKYGFNDLLPSVENLWNIQAGLHEYLALGVIAVRRQL